MNYKLGIIGGMGSMATVEFFKRIVDQTKANCDQEHLDLIILNHASMPDRTHSILNNNKDLFLKLIKDIELLENIGVSYIAITCNTSYYYIEELQKRTKLNIINMPFETLQYIFNNYGSVKVGLLGTTGTLKFDIYNKYASQFKIKIIKPNEIDQNIIMDSIYKLKQTKNLYYPEIEQIIIKMLKECDFIILGCTELSLMKFNIDSAKIIDAMDILVKKSIELVKNK